MVADFFGIFATELCECFAEMEWELEVGALDWTGRPAGHGEPADLSLIVVTPSPLGRWTTIGCFGGVAVRISIDGGGAEGRDAFFYAGDDLFEDLERSARRCSGREFPKRLEDSLVEVRLREGGIRESVRTWPAC
jgi:hypothetical protein